MRKWERWESLVNSPKTVGKLLLTGEYDFEFDLMPIHLKNISVTKRLNLIKSGLNLLYRRSNPWSLPIHMQVELTNYCNLQCPVCPTGTNTLNRPAMFMPPDMFENLMKEVGPYLLTLALYAWGESLLHPHLAEILRVCQKYNTLTLVSTNGMNLREEKILKALTLHPPSYLIVAIDGLSEETNSQFRIGSKLEAILEGVHQLADLKRENGLEEPILHMRYIAMKHNQHELPNVKNFAEENKFDFLSIRTLSTIDSPANHYHDYVPDIESVRAYEYKNNERIQRHDFLCQNAFSYPTVFSNGCVVACEQDFSAKQPYGYIEKDNSFKRIWFSKKAEIIRRTIRDRPASYSFCRHCPFADRLTSSCSIEAHDLRKV